MISYFRSMQESLRLGLVMNEYDSNQGKLEFYVEDRVATADDIEENLITVAHSDARRTAIRAYNSEESFYQRASRSPFQAAFANVIGTVALARAFENDDHERAVRVHRSRAEWIKRELEELSSEESLSGGKLVQRAGYAAPLIEGPLLRTAVLYEHRDGSGNACFLLSLFPLPILGWFGMNDKGSSLHFSGVGVLYEHDWYQGRSFWFGGLHFWMPPMQLSFVRFEDIASSAYCLGI